jgi:lipopolysaccharide export LptBFGC system permease protein LptF
MGRTLFRYLFRDLVRVFFFSAVVIAGIMSFGGLLRPMTVYSLDALQVGQMWLYLMPAMMSYSLPIAAVFATSVVYGRLSADNELTACRSAGIGYGSICSPAIALGLFSAIMSLVFLGFVVPFFSLQAQKVIFANAAQLVASDIERTHSFTPPSQGGRSEQIVVLEQPTVMSYARDVQDPKLQVPRVFSLASEATLYVRQDDEGEVQIWGVLKDATRFTRVLGSRPQGGIGYQEIGPIHMPSPLEQNVKFMDIRRLKELAADPEKSRRIRSSMRDFIEREQRARILQGIAVAATGRPEGFAFDTGDQGEHPQLIATGARIEYDASGLLLTAGKQQIRIVSRRGAGRVYEARQVLIHADVDNEAGIVDLTVDLRDVGIPDPGGRIERASDLKVYSIPMSEGIRAVQQRKLSDYLREEMPSGDPERKLKRQAIVARNEVLAEMHARASFGVSCLVLVMVGAVLGMQFRSGDFLTAFSVSVVPAILTISLVVAGTQSAGDVSWKTLQNPIWLGLTLIWLGNVLALVLALWLYGRIRKT